LQLKDLLLAPSLTGEEVASLLRPYGFEEIKRADTNLQLIAEEPRVRQFFAEILEDFLSALGQTAEPDRGLNDFERFTRAAIGKTQLFSYLRDDPATVSRAATIFGGSSFLAEILIRNPEYFYWVFDPAVLKRRRTQREITRDFSQAVRLLKTKEDRLDLLRTFKRKEILRIGVRDLLREASVEEILTELSDLADVLIQKAYEICDRSLRGRYGTPSYQDRSGRQLRIGFAIIAMGKLGGGELNFSSDVDLLYLYGTRTGKTSGVRSDSESRIANADYFRRLAQQVTAALNTATGQGYVYRVDLRLRPEGEKGLIVQPLQGYRRYYTARGETWERLSLLKARPVGGDRSLGARFLKRIIPFLYGKPFGPSGLQEVGALKKRIDEKIDLSKQTENHVKLGRGGIREIEFIVQALQVYFGAKHPAIRERSTLKAIDKLVRSHFLSKEDARRLKEAYLFLRDAENKLQIVHDSQTHLLPTDPKGLRACALRLGYRDDTAASAQDQFLDDYRAHTGRVHTLFRLLFETPSEWPAFQKKPRRRR
jgi:glutamate-ammonia-ligase adenylyltransferase